MRRVQGSGIIEASTSVQGLCLHVSSEASVAPTTAPRTETPGINREEMAKGTADRRLEVEPIDQAEGPGGMLAKGGTLDVLQSMALASSRPGGPAALRLPPLRLP
ncbi:MAG: hypothetical protein QG597_4077 [Actinomycetota bacterium]|nr:hypothetical protein [Actinomycetota bacterium]